MQKKKNPIILLNNVGLYPTSKSPNANVADPDLRKEKGKVAGRPMHRLNANAPKRGGRRTQQTQGKKLGSNKHWKVPLLPRDFAPNHELTGTPLDV